MTNLFSDEESKHFANMLTKVNIIHSDKWRCDYVNPRILETDDDLIEMQERERVIGGKIKWKKGDACYWKKYTDYTPGKWIDEGEGNG